ncbi:hypothetical protein HWV62_37765, partial [Athelia sp. TMB]
MSEPDQDSTTKDPAGMLTNPEKPTPPNTNIVPSGDPDAQAMVITSLRSQVQDLYSQVTQLNGKLVQSYDRVSDLEDSLHTASTNVRQSSVKISELELERTQHLAALNTGLLVERSHVTAELTRLMEKATEEAAQRGQAETAKADIEKDLDDLSATLFQQANTMVAEARFARAQSERKVEDAELALKGAEEAVAMMQQQMQEMQAEKERSQREAHDALATMGKGKWVEKLNGAPYPVVRLISTHTPYQEFLLFVGHLRSTRATAPSIPPMTTLLSLPFLARLVAEDSLPQDQTSTYPAHYAELIYFQQRELLTHIRVRLSNSPPASPRRSNAGAPAGSQKQIYIFRLAPTAPSATANLGVSMLPMGMAGSYSSPSTSTPPQHLSAQTQQAKPVAPSTIYPLCPSGWCLTRLRSTCTLWAFVRTGIIDKVWDEEPQVSPAAVPSRTAGVEAKPDEQSTGKPPIPPRKRGLWSMASALGERAASWTESDKGRGSTPEKETEKVTRRVPPPLPPQVNGTAAAPKAGPLPAPPLPKRAVGRSRSATVSRSGSPAPIQTQPAPPVVEEEKEPAATDDAPREGNSDDHHNDHATAEEISAMHPAETLFHAGDAHEHDED